MTQVYSNMEGRSKKRGMMNLVHYLVAIIIIAGLAANDLNAQGPNTSWNGSVSSDWFDANNWNNGVPGPGRRATIGWVNSANHMPEINGVATMDRLTMQSNNNSLTLLDGAELIVTDNFSISNTSTLIANNADLHVEGNLTSQGLIDFASGNITVDGNLSISGNEANSDFGTTNITVNGSFSSTGNAYFGDATFNANGGFSVGNAQNFYLNNGILNINGNSSLGGNLIVDQGGTVNVYADFTIGASSNLTLIDGSINFFGNSVITGSGNFNAIAGDVYFGENVSFTGSGSFSAGESTVVVDGSNWSMIGGVSMDPGTSTFIFTGDAQIISGGGGINEITFYNLMILDDSNVYSEIDIIVLNDMTVDDESDFVTAPDATLNVIGDVIGDPFIDSENPYIISVATVNDTTILILFNDELDAASAENISNYQVEDEAGPLAAELGGDNNNEVTLTLGFTMVEDTQYFLIANNIENTMGGVISQNHRKRFGITEPIDEEIDLDDAIQALADAADALNNYLDAGGSETDQVYVDVIDAINDLQDALDAEPQDMSAIADAVNNLIDATDILVTATQLFYTPDPSTTTAAISEGIAGDPTTITVTVRNNTGMPLEGHADLLTASLSGVNAGQGLTGPAESGDGVYVFTYIPEAIGDDVLEVFLGGVAIQGSPYTTSVAAGMPATLTLLDHPIAGTAGQPLAPASIVEVRDAFNNPVEGALIQAVVNKNAFCGLCDSAVYTDENGIATFANLVISIADDGYQISFRTEGQGGDDIFSTSFDLNLGPNQAAKVVVFDGPTTTLPGILSKRFSLMIQDAFGNQTSFVDDVRLILTSTSNNIEFVPDGGNPNQPTNEIVIDANNSIAKFRVRDFDPGFQIINIDFGGFIIRNQETQQLSDRKDLNRDNGFFIAGEVEVENTDRWVWIAKSGNGKDDDWTNEVNWNKESGTPPNNAEVVIRSMHADIAPRINGVTQLDIDLLEIEGDLPVTLQPGTQLTVNRIVNLNDRDDNNEAHPIVLIESTHEGSGSFIHNDPEVSAVVQHYISGASNAWHQMSSPVNAQSIRGDSGDFVSEGALFTWYEPSQSWVSHNNTSSWPTWSDANFGSDNLIPGRGYMAAFPDNPTKTFEGTLNLGDITFNMHRYAHPDDSFVGFNMLGNPYASSIDWKAEGWEGQQYLESPTIWIWNDAEKQYGVYDASQSDDFGSHGASRYIAPMQGFWVRAAEGYHGQTLRMTNDIRRHSDHEGRNNHMASPDVLRLFVEGTGSNYRDEVLFEFNHSNAGHGAQKMFSMYDEVPSLYAFVNEQKQSISFFGHVAEEGAIPVHFEAGVSDTYQISMETNGHFGTLILEDLFTGKLHDLSNGLPYVFDAHPSDPSDRFLLHTGGDDATSTDDRDPADHIHMYSHDNTLFVRSNGYETRVALFDMQGRQVLSEVLYGEGLHTLPLHLRAGVYVVRAISGNVQESTQIIQK